MIFHKYSNSDLILLSAFRQLNAGRMSTCYCRLYGYYRRSTEIRGPNYDCVLYDVSARVYNTGHYAVRTSSLGYCTFVRNITIALSPVFLVARF